MPISLPPRYINSPPTVLFDKYLPDGPARTLLQLLGLFWDKNNPPKFTVDDFSNMTGKTRSTIYGHLAALRNSGWLLFSTAHDGTLSVTFNERLDQSKILDQSKNLDSSLFKESLDDSRSDKEEIKEEEVQNFRRKKRDPLLDNEAVKLYRFVVHLTANSIQRKWIAETVVDVESWRSSLEHWLGHGWSPTNVTGMLDSYRRGGKAACSLCRRNHQSTKSKQDRNLDALKEWSQNGQT